MFEMLVYSYMLFLAVALVCDIVLLWDSYKTEQRLEELEREQELRFAKFRQVEHQFLKVDY